MGYDAQKSVKNFRGVLCDENMVFFEARHNI